MHLGGRYAGAQCKHVVALTTGEIEDIVADADAFRPSLGEFLIVTTLRRDASLQAFVRTLNEHRLNGGRCATEILFWEDVSLDLSGDNTLLAKYFPGWSRIDSEEEPQFEVRWIQNGLRSQEITIPALSRYCTDIMGVLDPYDDDELAFVRAHSPQDTEDAEAFNRTVATLASDPDYRARWRASHAAQAFDEGTRIALEVNVTNAASADILITLEFFDAFDLFAARRRPKQSQTIEMPEHPALACERRWVIPGFELPDLTRLSLDPWQLANVHITSSTWIRAVGHRATLHIDRSAPRRSWKFEGDDALVIAPWSLGGRYSIRWQADAENRKTPQTGELTLIVAPPAELTTRRRASYIGPRIRRRVVRTEEATNASLPPADDEKG
jgi:hypothetical protein